MIDHSKVELKERLLKRLLQSNGLSVDPAELGQKIYPINEEENPNLVKWIH